MITETAVREFIPPTLNPKFEYNIRVRKRVRAEAVKYLGGTCSVCGVEVNSTNFHLHYRDPLKSDWHAHKALWGGLTSEAKLELDECNMMCADCHIAHQKRLGR